jgi:hypothetical protein
VRTTRATTSQQRPKPEAAAQQRPMPEAAAAPSQQKATRAPAAKARTKDPFAERL